MRVKLMSTDPKAMAIATELEALPDRPAWRKLQVVVGDRKRGLTKVRLVPIIPERTDGGMEVPEPPL